MSDRDDEKRSSQPPSEPHLTAKEQRGLADVLAELDMLLPETPDEVARAERELQEASVQLPPRLAQFEPATKPPVLRLVPNRAEASAPTETPQTEEHATAQSPNRWLSGGLGFLLGAAAVAVAWLSTPKPEPSPPTMGGVGNELRERPEPLDNEPLKVQLAASCDNCCAGSECRAATGDATSCASGRTCISCGTADAKNAFRLRISAVGFGETGRAWATQHGALENMQVCAQAQGRTLGCRPAIEHPTDLVEWTSLPVASTSSQLVGGLELQLRLTEKGKEPRTLATWSNSVTVSADTLCRGLAARLATPEGQIVGRVSAFFDDAYFVELARAGTVADLLETEKRFEFVGDRDGGPRIYQTSGAQLEFALVIGPTDRARADDIRWQLLDQGFEAPISFGRDHRGAPRPR